MKQADYQGHTFTLNDDCYFIAADGTGEVWAFDTMPEYKGPSHTYRPTGRIYEYVGTLNNTFYPVQAVRAVDDRPDACEVYVLSEMLYKLQSLCEDYDVKMRTVEFRAALVLLIESIASKEAINA